MLRALFFLIGMSVAHCGAQAQAVQQEPVEQQPVQQQPVQQQPISKEAARAVQAKDFAKAIALLDRDLAGCIAARPERECLLPIAFGAMMSSFSGAIPEGGIKAKRALALAEATYESDSTQYAFAVSLVQASLLLNGDFVEAERVLAQAFQIESRKFGPYHPDSLELLAALTSAMWINGKMGEAEALVRPLIAAAATPAQQASLLALLDILSDNLVSQGRYADAVAAQFDRLELLLQANGVNSPDVRVATLDLAETLMSAEEPGRAEDLLLRLLRQESLNGVQRSKAHQLLGRIARNREDYDAAEIHFQKSLGLFRQEGMSELGEIQVQLQLALVYIAAKKYRSAQAVLLPLKKQGATAVGIVARQLLMFCYHELGRHHDAVSLVREVGSQRLAAEGGHSSEATWLAAYYGSSIIQSGGDGATGRSWLRLAQRRALQAVRQRTDFDGEAQRALRSSGGIFLLNVRGAWILSQRKQSAQ